MNKQIIFGMVVVIQLAGLSASAQDAGNADKEQAVQLFKKAVKAYKSDDFETAVGLFINANELNPSWKLHFNIGQCYGVLKQYGKALDEFESYLAKGGDDVPSDRRTQVLGEIAQFKQMVGTLTITGPRGALVSVDGEQRGTLPLKGLLRISSGLDHRVTVRQGVHVLFDEELRLGSEESRQIQAALPGEERPVPPPVSITEKEPESKPAPMSKESETEPVSQSVAPTGETQSTEPPGKSKKKAIAWTLVGIGGASIIAGSVTGGMALGKNSELSEKCVNGECLPSEHDTLESRDALALTSTILFGVGLAATTAGILVLAVNRGERAETANLSEIELVPVATGEFAGAILRGRF